jgi:hypothetical protein
MLRAVNDHQRSDRALVHSLRGNSDRFIGTYRINISHANASDSHE